MAEEDPDVEYIVQSLKSSTIHEGSSSSNNQLISNQNWKKKIVGRILQQDQPVRFQSLENTLLFIWKDYHIQSVTEHPKNRFTCEFSTADDIDKLIEDSPWNYKKDYIVFEKMDEDTQIQDYKLDKIALWVQLHHLKDPQLNPDIVENLLKGYGRMHPIDPLSVPFWKSFARARVTFNTDFRVLEFARSRKDNGDYVVASLRYERLHRVCNICCKVGHIAINCESRKKVQRAIAKCNNEDLRNELTSALKPKISDRVLANAARTVTDIPEEIKTLANGKGKEKICKKRQAEPLYEDMDEDSPSQPFSLILYSENSNLQKQRSGKKQKSFSSAEKKAPGRIRKAPDRFSPDKDVEITTPTQQVATGFTQLPLDQ